VKLVQFDMWQGSQKIALGEVLASLPENSLRWRMLWLDGVGSDWLGHNSIGELEEAAREAPMGVTVEWAALKSFASRLTDLSDVLLAAETPQLRLQVSEVRSGTFDSASIVIEGFDASLWTIGSSDEDIVRALPKNWNVRDVRS